VSAGSVGESLEEKAPPTPPARPGIMTIGPDGKPQWTAIDLPAPPPGPPVEPTYHTMEGHAMGDDLKAGGRYKVDDEGNVIEKPADPTEPLTEAEKDRAKKVFPDIDLDKSGYWEDDEVSAMYKAGNAQEWFTSMDRSPSDGKVSESEFLAALPKIKPLRGTRSLRFTLRHLEKNAKGLEKDVQMAEATSLHLLHYVPERVEAVEEGDKARLATYQILVAKGNEKDKDYHNLYVDIELPEGARITQGFYYREGNVPYGQLPTRECAQTTKEGQPLHLRCKIPRLEVRVTIYVHATYPEDVYDSEELQEMRAKETKVTAAVMVAGKVMKTTSTAFMRTDKEEL